MKELQIGPVLIVSKGSFKILIRCWRYGVVLKELDLKEEAVAILVQAVEKEPLLWASWTEIALLCKTKEEVLLYMDF